MKERHLLAVLCVLLVAVVAATGCRSVAPAPVPKPPVTTEPTVAPPPQPEKRAVAVYFVRGESLGVAMRDVDTAEDTAALVQAAITELVKGPSSAEKAAGLGTTIPDGTTCLSARIDKTTAVVNLSRSFESGGGSLSMLLRVAEIVYTATQFEGVNAVRFELDGKAVEYIGGEGVVVSPSASRKQFEGQLPPILLEAPAPNALVTSPVTIRGVENVFEAQFNAKVLDANGATLAEAQVMGQGGNGVYGPFEQSITFKSPTTSTGTVVVYDISEKDGSVINEVKVPVTFK